VPRIKPAAANRLLAALPRKDHRRLLAGCESVELVFAEVLAKPGEGVRHVYFPTESFFLLPRRRTAAPAWRSGWSATRACLGSPSYSGWMLHRCEPLYRARAERCAWTRCGFATNSTKALHYNGS